MNALTRQALAGEELRRSFADHGATPWWTTPEDLDAYRAALATLSPSRAAAEVAAALKLPRKPLYERAILLAGDVA